MTVIMMAEMLFFKIFFKKDSHLNMVEKNSFRDTNISFTDFISNILSYKLF